MTSLGSKFMRSLGVFKEAWTASDPPHVPVYEGPEARRGRYAIFTAFYENTAYRRVHKWAKSFKHPYGMYDDVRNLYNPATQLGDLSSALIWGGALDRNAEAKGAIPIDCDDPELRAAIAQLWIASRFATQKDVWTLRGTIEGDLVVRVVDDASKEKVYLERIDPSTLEWAKFDAQGNIKAYIITEERQHPNKTSRTVEYREVVSRKGDLVIFETFLNNKPYGWEGHPARWEEAYTFVPLVLIKHKDTGLDYGASELLSGLTKIRELDDLASMLSDYIRKTIDPGWYVSGAAEGDLTVSKADRDLTGRYPEPGREDTKIIYGPEGSKMEALIADLNIGDALTHVAALEAELEKMYPLLQQDIWATGVTSGRALRVARQRVEQTLRLRRESYDSGLVRAQQQAIAIGGWREYDGYKGFDLESYAKGDLSHAISVRPVFEPDPLDKSELDLAFWKAATEAGKAGVPLGGYLKEVGWDEERIAELLMEDTNQEKGDENEQVL